MLAIKNREDLQKNLMFSMIQEMIVSEHWTVNYCSYLVEHFEKLYPKEKSSTEHLKKNLKILSDKKGAEESRIMSKLFKVE